MNPPRSQAYTLLIPSRRRVENAAATLALLPGAKVYVDEREADEYARAVGIGQKRDILLFQGRQLTQ